MSTILLIKDGKTFEAKLENTATHVNIYPMHRIFGKDKFKDWKKSAKNTILKIVDEVLAKQTDKKVSSIISEGKTANTKRWILFPLIDHAIRYLKLDNEVEVINSITKSLGLEKLPIPAQFALDIYNGTGIDKGLIVVRNSHDKWLNVSAIANYAQKDIDKFTRTSRVWFQEALQLTWDRFGRKKDNPNQERPSYKEIYKMFSRMERQSLWIHPFLASMVAERISLQYRGFLHEIGSKALTADVSCISDLARFIEKHNDVKVVADVSIWDNEQLAANPEFKKAYDEQVKHNRANIERIVNSDVPFHAEHVSYDEGKTRLIIQTLQNKVVTLEEARQRAECKLELAREDYKSLTERLGGKKIVEQNIKLDLENKKYTKTLMYEQDTIFSIAGELRATKEELIRANMKIDRIILKNKQLIKKNKELASNVRKLKKGQLLKPASKQQQNKETKKAKKERNSFAAISYSDLSDSDLSSDSTDYEVEFSAIDMNEKMAIRAMEEHINKIIKNHRRSAKERYENIPRAEFKITEYN